MTGEERLEHEKKRSDTCQQVVALISSKGHTINEAEWILEVAIERIKKTSKVSC